MNKEIYGYDIWNMEMKGYKRNMLQKNKILYKWKMYLTVYIQICCWSSSFTLTWLKAKERKLLVSPNPAGLVLSCLVN
jgi:hypothetical protein